MGFGHRVYKNWDLGAKIIKIPIDIGRKSGPAHRLTRTWSVICYWRLTSNWSLTPGVKLRMAELGGELPRGVLEARDVVDEVARVCLEQPAKKPKALTCEQWFYQLIRQELDRQCRLYAEERSSRIEPAPQERASTDGEDEGYDAEQPLGIITSEIEPEEDLPEHRIPDRAIVPPDAAISGQELVEILQEEIKHWVADEQQVFELYFLVGFDTGEIAMIRRQSKTQVEATIRTIQSRLRQFMRVS